MVDDDWSPLETRLFECLDIDIGQIVHGQLDIDDILRGKAGDGRRADVMQIGSRRGGAYDGALERCEILDPTLSWLFDLDAHRRLS